MKQVYRSATDVAITAYEPKRCETLRVVLPIRGARGVSVWIEWEVETATLRRKRELSRRLGEVQKVSSNGVLPCCCKYVLHVDGFVVPRNVEEDTDAVVLRCHTSQTVQRFPGPEPSPQIHTLMFAPERILITLRDTTRLPLPIRKPPDPKVERDERGDRETQASRRP